MNIVPIILKLIGGNPLNRVTSIIANGLPIPNINFFGGLGNLMQDVMDGGLGAVFQNPLAGALGDIQGAIGDVAGALADIPDMVGDLAGALQGDLAEALGDLGNVSDLLSGVTGGLEGSFGLMDVISHARTLEDLASIPASLGMDKVLAPLAMLDTLQNDVLGFVQSLPTQLADGLITEADAVAQIASHVDAIQGAISASSTALSSLNNNLPALATVGSAAAGFINGPLSVQAHLSSIVQPQAMEKLQVAIQAHMSDLGAGPGTTIEESDVL